MGSLTHYVVRSVWSAPVPPADVFAVLADLPTYPAWWPDVAEVSRAGDGFEAVCRGPVPYELRVGVRLGACDEHAGIIEGLLSGDLEGYARWTVRPDDDGTRLIFDQEVEARARLLVALAPLVRPIFRAGQAAMMRHGATGLRTFVAGYHLGRGERGPS